MPKINRPLAWIRKALEVTEKTDAPRGFDANIRTILDAFGWERLNETVTTRSVGVNVDVIQSPAVPEGVLRLVTSACVETSNTALPFTLWIEHTDGTGAGSIGIMRPIEIPISATVIIKAGVERIHVLRSGDSLRGRSSPASGIGFDLRISLRFVDLPIVGEYVAGL